uniref:hypothetical protein n=1 Tax=Candidatus Electronema sp. TaxID=2698783 RepID=UPI0040564F7E
MSKSPSKQTVALSVRAADSLTEVFLADSRFQLIASGIGRAEAAVAPGLYKARFRVGQVQTDSLIEVASGARSQIFDGPPVQFASPAPLAQTLTWREEHGAAAKELSRAKHAPFKTGSGSQLFLCLRGLSDEAARPWLGVSLHNIHGELLAEAAHGICAAESRFCALHLELDPGLYRLRVEDEPGEVYEIFVQTLAGWQTQVFAVAEQSWQPGVDAVRAALPEAAVLMAEIGKGFDPASPAARQTELLRLGLLHGRKILTEPGLKSLLAAQPLNPMNVLYAAYLIPKPDESDMTVLLVLQLDKSLAELSDIHAVLIDAGSRKRPSVFALPPLFSKGWQLLMEGADKEKAVITPGSLSEKIQGRTLNSSLWLLHQLR